MDLELLKHIAGNRARFDRELKFIYLPNGRCMSGTTDLLLGRRACHQKMNSDCYNHLKPLFRKGERSELIDKFKELDREEITIFTVVRHPLDRIVSALHYCSGEAWGDHIIPQQITYEYILDFCDFYLKGGIVPHNDIYPFFHKIEYEGNKFVDFIIHYENAHEELKQLEDLGLLDVSLKDMPHERQSNVSSYSEFHTDELLEKVKSFYAKDFVLGEYN